MGTAVMAAARAGKSAGVVAAGGAAGLAAEVESGGEKDSRDAGVHQSQAQVAVVHGKRGVQKPDGRADIPYPVEIPAHFLLGCAHRGRPLPFALQSRTSMGQTPGGGGLFRGRCGHPAPDSTVPPVKIAARTVASIASETRTVQENLVNSRMERADSDGAGAGPPDGFSRSRQPLGPIRAAPASDQLMDYPVRNHSLVSTMVLAVAVAAGGAVHAQDVQSLVRRAVQVQIHADDTDHSCWVFHEVDRKPGDSVVQWVAQTHAGDVTRVVKKNGQPVSKADQRQHVESFVHDASAQAQQRKDDSKDDQQARSMLELLPVAFDWKMVKRDRNTTTLAFSPKASFNPPTREARVFSAMQGFLVLQNNGDRIIEFKGHLIHDVDFGLGLLGKLNQGGTFRIERRDVGDGLWDITESHIHIQGHALIFKSISEEEDDVKTSYKREPDSVTLQQAASTVLSR